MSKQNKLYKQLLSPSSLTDQACNMIKEVILSDKYSPNQRLNEVELASSLGVSRGPIREAFQRLAYEGLVKLVPNKGVGPSFKTTLVRQGEGHCPKSCRFSKPPTRSVVVYVRYMTATY